MIRFFLTVLTLFSIFLCICNAQTNYAYRKIPNEYIRKISKTVKPMPQNTYNLTKALPVGYKRDGSVDYTAYLQDALDKYDNVFFPNFPVMINDNGLKLRSNTNLYFDTNSKLVMKPSDKGTNSNSDVYQILLLEKVTDVVIHGAKLVGDKNTHKGSIGEWGMGINISSSKNIEIYDVDISNCWGDGIYIGREKKGRGKDGYYIPSENIVVKNSLIDNNRRNGISITCGVNILIENTLISNTSGTLPMSGIDIEPNIYLDKINDIRIRNVTTFNNARDGILLVLTRLTHEKVNNPCNIIIENHIDDSSFSAMRLGSGFPRKNKGLVGKIEINNSIWKNSKGLRFRKVYDHLPNVVFSKIKKINISDNKEKDIYNSSSNKLQFSEFLKREKNIRVK